MGRLRNPFVRRSWRLVRIPFNQHRIHSAMLEREGTSIFSIVMSKRGQQAPRNTTPVGTLFQLLVGLFGVWRARWVMALPVACSHARSCGRPRRDGVRNVCGVLNRRDGRRRSLRCRRRATKAAAEPPKFLQTFPIPFTHCSRDQVTCWRQLRRRRAAEKGERSGCRNGDC